MEDIINETLAKGVELHLAGELDLASKLYGSVIKLQPKHADANHNMGLLNLDKGHDLDALPYLQMALQADTSIAQFWLSYINALIKLERRDEAARIISLAKENGMEGEEFLVLSQKLSAQDKVATVIERQADTENKSKSNILDKLKLDKALNLAKTKTKTGSFKEAKLIYQDILEKFPKNKKAQQGLIASKTQQTHNRIQSPSQEIINQLMNFYNKGDLVSVVEKAQTLIKQYPDAFMIWNILGAANRGLGKLDEALKAFQKVTKLNPDNADAHYNLGVVLQRQVKLGEAIAAYNKSLSLKPDKAEVCNNLGTALKDQGRLQEALEAFQKALRLKPYYADAHYNMGNTLKDQGLTDDAIAAYNNALSVNPDLVGAYNNLGNALQDKGKLDEAMIAYKKVLSFEPAYGGAHRNISALKKYKPDDKQISHVKNLLKRDDLKENDRCQLLFAFAKMNEDIGHLDAAYHNYVAGGIMRKQSLAYDLEQDRILFDKIKNSARRFKDLAFNPLKGENSHSPIFILGMPRSGTTLIEQIISCHSLVQGAGELPLIPRIAGQLSVDEQDLTPGSILQVRETYLTELFKVSQGKPFVTDKLPENFLHIGVILKILPEAKIIHVKRDPAATCWSNFTHYFPAKTLGYSYSLEDLVNYFKMYKDLIEFWEDLYPENIYHLNYEQLTAAQNIETRRLIKYLGLEWEDTCLSPENNKRIVRTASQQQVRKKIYKGSSETWRKFAPYLNGAFDELQ